MPYTTIPGTNVQTRPAAEALADPNMRLVQMPDGSYQGYREDWGTKLTDKMPYIVGGIMAAPYVAAGLGGLVGGGGAAAGEGGALASSSVPVGLSTGPAAIASEGVSLGVGGGAAGAAGAGGVGMAALPSSSIAGGYSAPAAISSQGVSAGGAGGGNGVLGLLGGKAGVVNSGLNLLGGWLGSRAATNAAKTQAESAEKALALAREMWQTQRQDQMPWMQAGQGAVTQLSRLLGVNGGAQGGGQMVTLRAPDGSTKQVPAQQAAYYQAKGAQVVG